MRRKDREVVDLPAILQVVNRCDTCRIALIDQDRKIRIIPMNFGYTYLENTLSLYFHGAGEGDKIGLLQKAVDHSQQIAFEMDADHLLVPGAGGSITMKYVCAMGYGTPVFIENTDEKRTALMHLTAHYVSGIILEEATKVPDELLDRMCVFRLDVTEITCKVNR